MVLQTFREKLSYEIKRFEEFYPYGLSALDKLQVHLYCIAILVRKIIEMLPGYDGKNVRVSELYDPGGGEDLDMCLKDLINKIIHYVKFSPGIVMSVNPSSMEYIQIISDKEKAKVEYRELRTADFLNIAKEIAENDRKVLKHLLTYAIENLERDINCTDPSIISGKHFGVKTRESITYAFRIIRQIGNYKLPDGSITVFFEITEGNEAIQIEEHDVEYSDFFEYFGHDWYISLGDRYLKTCQETYNSKLEGNKVIPIYNVISHSLNIKGIQYYEEKKNNKYNKCIIVAENLLDILNQI